MRIFGHPSYMEPETKVLARLNWPPTTFAWTFTFKRWLWRRGWSGRAGLGGVSTRVWYSGVRNKGFQAGVDEVWEGLGMGVPVVVKHTKGLVGMVGADDRWGWRHWVITKEFSWWTKSFSFELDHACQDLEVDIVSKGHTWIQWDRHIQKFL